MAPVVPSPSLRREKGDWPQVVLKSVKLIESADKSLRRAVLARLISDPLIGTGHICVSVVAGVVVLSGYVTSSLQKDAAGAAARRVKGVGLISDEVTVATPHPPLTGPAPENMTAPPRMVFKAPLENELRAVQFELRP